jgi:hypothetical protein
MDENCLYNKIIQACDAIENNNRKGVGDYIVLGSRTVNILNKLFDEYENRENIKALRKLRKQKLEKIKKVRNSNPY